METDGARGPAIKAKWSQRELARQTERCTKREKKGHYPLTAQGLMKSGAPEVILLCTSQGLLYSPPAPADGAQNTKDAGPPRPPEVILLCTQ